MGWERGLRRSLRPLPWHLLATGRAPRGGGGAANPFGGFFVSLRGPHEGPLSLLYPSFGMPSQPGRRPTPSQQLNLAGVKRGWVEGWILAVGERALQGLHGGKEAARERGKGKRVV